MLTGILLCMARKRFCGRPTVDGTPCRNGPRCRVAHPSQSAGRGLPEAGQVDERRAALRQGNAPRPDPEAQGDPTGADEALEQANGYVESALTSWRACLDLRAAYAMSGEPHGTERLERLTEDARSAVLDAESSRASIRQGLSAAGIESALVDAQSAAEVARGIQSGIAVLAGVSPSGGGQHGEVSSAHLRDAASHVREAAWEATRGHYRGKRTSPVKEMASHVVAADIGKFLRQEKIAELVVDVRSNIKGGLSEREQTMIKNAVARSAADSRSAHQEGMAHEFAEAAKARAEVVGREIIGKIQRGELQLRHHSIGLQAFGAMQDTESDTLLNDEIADLAQRLTAEMVPEGSSR